LGPDPGLDDTSDLVAIPGDHPEAGIELRTAVRQLEILVGLLPRAPVVAERIALRVKDRAMLIGADRPDLQAVGQGSVGDVVQGRAAHVEEPADRFESRALEEGAVAGLVLSGLAADVDDLAGRLTRRPFGRPSEVLAQQRSAQAAPTDAR